MKEHLDKHCDMDCGDYVSSEGYASETKSVGESPMNTLMEAWNKDTLGKQSSCTDVLGRHVPLSITLPFICCLPVHKKKQTERR